MNIRRAHPSPRSTGVILAVLAGMLSMGCDGHDDTNAPNGATDSVERRITTTSRPDTTTSSHETTTTIKADDARSGSTAEPALPTTDEMLSTAQEFFATIAQHDFAGASELFVDSWTFESFGGGTLSGGDGDDLVDVLGFNGTILSFEPGACEADETGRPPIVRCHETRVHGPLPTALAIKAFPLPLDLLFAQDGRLVGVLPNRAALERHPDALATVAASSRVGLDLTSWITESTDDASTLLRAPGRTIIPTVENAERIIELAREFATQPG